MILVQARVQHSMHGRTRFRVAERRGDQNYFDRTAEALRGINGVEGVHTNSATGSILVSHSSDLNALVRQAEQAELFQIASEGPRVLPTLKARKLLETVDGRITSSTDGKWDLNGVLMLSCAVVGVLQIARHNVWPAAASMFWYALSLAKEKNDVRQREQ